jgi:signal transduction histidine kinase/CheY-like chemotaxis protein
MLGYESVDHLMAAIGEGVDVLHAASERVGDFRARLADEGVVLGFEYEAARRDGAAIWLSEHARAARDAGGGITGIEGMVEDITGRKQLEAQLRQSQKMEAVGRLAGGVAHDFNNLLTAILGYSSLMMDRIGPDNPLRRELDEIWNAGNRAASLTGQLLAFSRRQVLQPIPMDLNQVVEGIQTMLRRLIGEDVRLEAELDAGLWPVRADPGQIEQVIMNLAVNARDAMPDGGRLTIRTANLDLERGGRPGAEPASGQWVMLEIRDTGCGMDDETRSHVFEPFFTTKGPGKGTGLGLAVVYGIVKQSGGHIMVASAPGQGATLTILLPREDAPAEAFRNAAGGAPVGMGSGTVLVVEDEEAVRGLTVRVLRKAGYTVLEAPDADRAIELSRGHPGTIDLLFTDVVMPGMGGRDLATALGAERPGMQILFTSGYTERDSAALGLSGSGVSFLQKPFSPARLVEVVRESLLSGTVAGQRPA